MGKDSFNKCNKRKSGIAIVTSKKTEFNIKKLREAKDAFNKRNSSPRRYMIHISLQTSYTFLLKHINSKLPFL